MIEAEFADAPIALQHMIAELRADLDAAIHTAQLWGHRRRAKKAAATNGHGGTTITHALALDAARRARTRGEWSRERDKRRRRSAAILKTLSKTMARPIPGTGRAAALIRQGYIVKKDDGYVLTDKKFEA